MIAAALTRVRPDADHALVRQDGLGARIAHCPGQLTDSALLAALLDLELAQRKEFRSQLHAALPRMRLELDHALGGQGGLGRAASRSAQANPSGSSFVWRHFP